MHQEGVREVRSLGRHRRKQKRPRKARVVEVPLSMLFIDEYTELFNDPIPSEAGSVLADRIGRFLGKDRIKQ